MITQVLKRVLFSINLISATALVGGLIAGFISPNDIPLLVLFGLLFPYFLIINLIFLLFWGLLKHRYFILSAIVILISIPLIIDTFQFIQKKNKADKSVQFKVLSYNVRVFDLYNWTQNKVTRNKIFQLIRDENPQIACFQEYFNNTNNYFPVHDSLIKNQSFNNSHICLNVKLKNGHNFGIATYSSFPIINKKNIEFSNTHNLAIISDIKINDDTIRVINCHLESVRFLAEDYHFMDSLPILSEERTKKGFTGVIKRLLKASIKRASQADIIASEIKQSPFPVLLCGDFNDTPSSYTFRKIVKLMNDSHKYHKIGVGGTFNSFLYPLRIDYILFNDRIECSEFKTIKVKYSDHYPIVGNYFLHL